MQYLAAVDSLDAYNPMNVLMGGDPASSSIGKSEMEEAVLATNPILEVCILIYLSYSSY